MMLSLTFWLASGCTAASLFLAACATAPRADGEHDALAAGRKVHYEERGSGPRALVFVHGWSSDHRAWQKQMDEFTEWHRIAIDLPGQGGSSLPAEPLSMETQARAVAAVMDDAGVERAVLLGHSNGTPVIRQFYRMFPERVLGLVIVDGPLKSFFDEPAQAEQFLAIMQGPNAVEQVQAGFVDPMLVPMKEEGDRRFVRAMLLATPPETMLASFRATLEPLIWAEDPIEKPVLLLMAVSRFWDDDYKALAGRIAPRATWIDYAGVSHFLMLDDPGKFASDVRAWLAACGFAP